MHNAFEDNSSLIARSDKFCTDKFEKNISWLGLCFRRDVVGERWELDGAEPEKSGRRWGFRQIVVTCICGCRSWEE